MDGPIKKVFKEWNIVVPQTEFFAPRSCEYYLHFNVKLPYPETEYKNCQIKKENLLKVTTLNKIKLLISRTGLFILCNFFRGK